MFADLNRYAIRPSRSISVLYAHRDEMSAITKLLVMRSALFSDLTDMETSNLAARSASCSRCRPYRPKALLDGVEVTLPKARRYGGQVRGLAAEQFPDGTRCTSARSAGEIRDHPARDRPAALGKIGVVWRWPARTQPAGAALQAQEIDCAANTAL